MRHYIRIFLKLRWQRMGRRCHLSDFLMAENVLSAAEGVGVIRGDFCKISLTIMILIMAPGKFEVLPVSQREEDLLLTWIVKFYPFNNLTGENVITIITLLRLIHTTTSSQSPDAPTMELVGAATVWLNTHSSAEHPRGRIATGTVVFFFSSSSCQNKEKGERRGFCFSYFGM